eukprot:1193364-Prorocentrum_minimum.AAC.2
MSNSCSHRRRRHRSLVTRRERPKVGTHCGAGTGAHQSGASRFRCSRSSFNSIAMRSYHSDAVGRVSIQSRRGRTIPMQSVEFQFNRDAVVPFRCSRSSFDANRDTHTTIIPTHTRLPTG